MASNPSVTELDTAQALKRAFDSSNDAMRVDIISSLASSLSIAASDGDTILAVGTEDGAVSGTQHAMKVSSDGTLINQPNSYAAKASLTNASSGVVLAAFSAVGLKTFNIVLKTTATLTGPQALTVEISPSDTDNVWVATTITATPSGTNAVVVSATAASLIARRARVSIAAAVSTGTFDLYLVAQAN